MQVSVRDYTVSDMPQMLDIWNGVVAEGRYFPQEQALTMETATQFFKSQTCVRVATDEEAHTVLGLYILHPNNVGHCSHVSNASYAVNAQVRGKRIGERLISDCLEQAAAHGFKILQFNAVVASNTPARNLYKKLGFVEIGTVPGAYHRADGVYDYLFLYYHKL